MPRLVMVAVAGTSYTAGGATAHAFLWTAAGGMIDLGTLDSSTDGGVTGINNAG
jgi:probable HAF family extracellular repeat protein